MEFRHSEIPTPKLLSRSPDIRRAPMTSRVQRAGLCVAALITFAVGLRPDIAAAFSPAQAAPTSPAPLPGAGMPHPLSLEQRADIFMARKNYAGAAGLYYRALQGSAYKDPMLWNKLGIAYQEENDFHDAHTAFTHAIRVDKKFADSWNNLGTVYFMQKRYAKSVKYYQRAIAVREDVAAFHMNLGTSFYHLKKYDQAVKEYRTALNIDPKVMVQQSAVGTVIHAGSTDADFYFYMAKAFASVGKEEEAVRYLRRALEDGFGGRERIDEDPDFQKISQYPDYIELMRRPPAVIKN
jgi:tetratricopeptide (TPR) repeat protein